jgi:hypothetical protein
MDVTLDLKSGVDSISIDSNRGDGNIEICIQNVFGNHMCLVLTPEGLESLIGRLKSIYDFHVFGGRE